MRRRRTLNNLSTFKKELLGILQSITTFNEEEKQEALNFARQILEEQSKSPTTETQLNLHRKETLLIKSKSIKSRTNKCMVIKRSLSSAKKHNFKCKSCNETKKGKVEFFKHLELHIGTPISCGVCCRSFTGRLSFEWHQIHMCKKKNTSRIKKYQCPECPQKFQLVRHLKLHIRGHKRNNCSYCDIVLTRREHLIQHMLHVHKIKLARPIYSCDHCEKRFVKRQSLFYHLKQHLPNKYICTECGYICDTSEEHVDHQRNHDERKQWQCGKCNDKFARKQQYICHMKRHDRYKCVTCKENYASKAHAYRHQKRGHFVQGLEPHFHCPHCPAAFHRTLLLQIHMRKHKEVTTSMICKFCDKSFHTPYQYYKHCKTTVHDKNSLETSQFICENCGKQFTKKYILEQHLQRFHGAKRNVLSCIYCDYQTQFKTNLERHINLHFSDQKQYMCDHCGKTFSNIAGLTDHIDYIHVQEKQFKCEECDKSFKRNSELVRHKSCHSDARPHACKLCGQTYKRINHLTRHEASAHKLVGKSKQVQRLKTVSNGTVVTVPKGKKPSTTKNNPVSEIVEPAYSFINEYFGSTMTIVNSDAVLENTSQVEKCNQIFDNSHSITSQTIPAVNSHSFNLVDQFVKSLTPSKELQMINCLNYNDFSNGTDLQYQNFVSDIGNESDILTNNEKIELSDIAW